MPRPAFGHPPRATSCVETYSYDAVSNLTGKTDRKNQLISYAYDGLNRLTQKSYPYTITVNYTNDLDIRLTAISSKLATIRPGPNISG